MITNYFTKVYLIFLPNQNIIILRYIYHTEHAHWQHIESFWAPNKSYFLWNEQNGWNSFVLFGRDRKINKDGSRVHGIFFMHWCRVIIPLNQVIITWIHCSHGILGEPLKRKCSLLPRRWTIFDLVTLIWK